MVRDLVIFACGTLVSVLTWLVWRIVRGRRGAPGAEEEPRALDAAVISFPVVAGSADVYLSKTDVAGYFGFSVRWVEKQMQLGMPHVRIGGRARFRVADAEAWLANQEGSRHGVSAS